MMRLNRPSAATAARKSHASRNPCERHFWCSRGRGRGPGQSKGSRFWPRRVEQGRAQQHCNTH
eukprot:11143838-Lingulodinium_polyedra.AAC.1